MHVQYVFRVVQYIKYSRPRSWQLSEVSLHLFVIVKSGALLLVANYEWLARVVMACVVIN